MKRLAGFLFVLAMFSLVAQPLCAAVAKGVQIPVIVNIYPGSGTNPAKAKAAIKEANKILKQAGMKMVVVKTNNPPGAGNGDDGDGKFTRAERNKMRTYGGKELAKLKNQKGIKISFGDQPTSEHPANPGVAVHRNPTIIVKDRGNDAQTGQTIAHELGHVMTLSRGHKINATTNANNGGHAPNRAGGDGNGNLMAPSNRRNGTNLTADQIKEMKKRKYVHGKCATQWKKAFPATKDKQQHGSGTDERDDQGTAHRIYDLSHVFLISSDTADTIDGQLTVAGVFPDTGTVTAAYVLGFDTDADAATGVSRYGYDGFDRMLHLTVTGTAGVYTVSGTVEDPIAETMIPLPETPYLVTEYEHYDDEYDAEPEESSILFRLPKSMLQMTADEVPVIVVSGASELAGFDAECGWNWQHCVYDIPNVFGIHVPAQDGHRDFVWQRWNTSDACTLGQVDISPGASNYFGYLTGDPGLRVSIHEDNGGAPGTEIAYQEFSTADIISTGDFGFLSATFPGQQPLVVGGTYYVVVGRASWAGEGDTLGLYLDTDECGGGSCATGVRSNTGIDLTACDAYGMNLELWVDLYTCCVFQSEVYDTHEFYLDLSRWLDDPTLVTFGTGIPTPGADYPFGVTGLEPNSPFELYLDDDLVYSGTLDNEGVASGLFAFPPSLPVEDQMYFLTAQDTTGEFAYSITCPDATCSCGETRGDLDCNGSLDPVDVVYMVNYVYKGLDGRCYPEDWNCPFDKGDVDCDGTVTPVDVVYYVNAVYKGLHGLCDPCDQ